MFVFARGSHSIVLLEHKKPSTVRRSGVWAEEMSEEEQQKYRDMLPSRAMVDKMAGTGRRKSLASIKSLFGGSS